MLTGSSSNRLNYTFIFGFLALYLLSVFLNWSVLPLDGEEPRRALVSIEMLQSGNYIRPTVFGWEYFNKPAVYNWILSFLMFLTGSTKEWLVRLPSLIFLLMWAFFHYQFSKKFFPKNIAVLSSLFLLTDFDLFFYALSSGGEIDVFYSFLVYIQVMLLFYFNQQQKWLQLFLWSYIFCAIGFLTKGFPSILFQAFTIVALCVFNRSIKLIFRRQHFVGILVFCFLVGSYLFAFSFYSSPQRLVINLLNESFLKSAVGEHSERLLKKVFVYPFSFFKLLLPWSLLLLLLFKRHFYRLFNNPLVRFSVLFIVFNLWIYALTGRPILRYVYAFIPFAFNIIVSIFWKANEEHPALIEKIFKYAGYVFICVLAGLMALPFFVNVSLMMIVLLSLILFGFIFIYHKIKLSRVWMFCLGVVLMRLIYAVLFIPIQESTIKVHYRDVAEKMSKANNKEDIRLWSLPDTVDVGLDLKYWKWKFERVIVPPKFTNYMLPYYSFYKSGHIMRYDTTLLPNKTYFTYQSKLANRDVSILWSWFDVRQKAQFVLFRIK
jgi:4-amino-4-deoxy-L-arabinose transferase-like glycosyltransferase